MRIPRRSLTILLAVGLLAPAVLGGSGSPASSPAPEAAAAATPQTQERGGQDMYGPYEVVENWLKPLPDGPDGVKHFLYVWGQPGGQPGQFWGPHQMSVDQEGNLYVAEVQNGRIQKLRPKLNADRARIVGQEVRLPARSSN